MKVTIQTSQVKQLRERRLQYELQLLIFLVTLIPFPSDATVCPDTQTAELAEPGYIHCSFPEDFYDVYWFDNISDSSPTVIQYQPSESAKRGPGLESKEYDVHEDGSLIITNVTIWHERVYKVIFFKRSSLAPTTLLISLKVIASPVDDLPVIPCGNCHQEYYYNAIQGEILSCSSYATRPPVQLEWLKKFGDGYEHPEMQQFNTTENSNGTFNSFATLRLLKDSTSFIHLLVCRTTWPLSDWGRERELFVDFSSNISFSNVTPKVQYMEINRYAKIQCGQSPRDYVVWKRILPNSKPEVIGFHSHVMTKTLSGIPGFEVSAEGSLMFAVPRVQHEGIYACISGDGQEEEIQMTSVELLIPPSPPYIHITGCGDVSHSCVFKEVSTKNLTCGVYGARPNVTLEWISGDDISFFNHKAIFKESGETFDTILSVEYKVSQDVLCGEEILTKCRLYGPLSKIMKVESTALVIPASCRDNEGKEENGLHVAEVALVVVSALLIVIVIVIFVIWIIYSIHGNRTKSRGSTSDSGVPSVDAEDAFLNGETREPARQIPNGKPLGIVNDRNEERL